MDWLAAVIIASCGTYILRCRYLPQNTADSGKSNNHRRAGIVYWTRCKRRTECMAVYWRANSRKHLGHGAYIAPDWTADYLHREAVLLLDELAKRMIKSTTIYQMKSRPDIRFCYRKNYGRILLIKLPIRL